MQLAKKVIIKGKKGRRPAKKKFNDHSKHHQKRIKNPLKEGCQTTLSFLGSTILLPQKLKCLTLIIISMKLLILLKREN